jgi:hypothetical protein
MQSGLGAATMADRAEEGREAGGNELRGTRVRAPDLDWSQVHETMLMLELAAGQIDAALTESSSSVDALTESFTSLAGHLLTMGAALKHLPDDGDVGRTKGRLKGAAENVNVMVGQAIVAFQFYDKLSQRLTHVCHSLSELSNLVADRKRIFSPDEWIRLQETIRSKYTSIEETRMFDAVLAGTPVKEALDEFVDTMKCKGNDIEFF